MTPLKCVPRFKSLASEIIEYMYKSNQFLSKTVLIDNPKVTRCVPSFMSLAQVLDKIFCKKRRCRSRNGGVRGNVKIRGLTFLFKIKVPSQSIRVGMEESDMATAEVY